MVALKNIQGSGAQAVPRIIGPTTVYIHSNIQKVTEPDPITGEVPEDLYTYDEEQYSHEEYIAMMDENIAATQEAVDYILMNMEG